MAGWPGRAGRPGYRLLALVSVVTLAFAPGALAETGAQAALPIATPLPPTPGDGEPQLLVVRVYVADPADRDRLAAELDAVEAPTTGGYLTALVSPAQHAALVQAGYRVEIDQARTDLVNAPSTGLPEQAEGIPGYICYRTVEETYADLAALAASHPQLATWVDIGDSWEKVTSSGAAGYDLFALVITNQARPGPKPVFFLMAAIHAREYATAELATRFAEHLVSAYGVDPDVTWLLDHYEVHVVPQANPDGRKLAETGLYHRKNTNYTAGSCLSTPFNQFGVDLNRNSSFHWGTVGSTTDPCSQTYRGIGPASEPEIVALQSYIAAIFPDQRGPLLTDPAPPDASGVLVTLHSYGRLVLFPWGDTTAAAPNETGLQTLGRKFGFYNNYTVCQPGDCLYLTSGTTDDWAYGELGVAAYTFEVGGDFFESCSVFESALLPDNLAALRYALQAARSPYQAPAGPETLAVTATVASLVAGQPFTLTAAADDTRYDSNGFGLEPVQPIAAARYTLDQPAWITGTAAYPLAAADGAFDSPSENLQAVVDTTGWAPGRHLVLAQSQDAAGNWGAPSAVFIWVEAGSAQAVLAPADSLAFGAAGQTVTHTLWLTNTGTVTATFDVTATVASWPVSVMPTVGPLAPGAGVVVTAAVGLPALALPGDYGQATLWVSPQSPAGPPVTATLLSVVEAPHGLIVWPNDWWEQAGLVGTTVTHTARFLAIGTLTDTYTITVTGNAWPVSAPAGVGPLAQGDAISIAATVQVPPSAAEGTFDELTLTLTAGGDPGWVTSVLRRTTALWHKHYFPFVWLE